MTTLVSKENLQELRERSQEELKNRYLNGTFIIIGMGTCGIAAGAREVMAEIQKELQRRHIDKVTVTKTGCIGMCEKEVLIDVVRPGEDRVTYARVVPRDVSRIIGEHIVNGRVVEDLVVGRITVA